MYIYSLCPYIYLLILCITSYLTKMGDDDVVERRVDVGLALRFHFDLPFLDVFRHRLWFWR